jgi:hypothetical protein
MTSIAVTTLHHHHHHHHGHIIGGFNISTIRELLLIAMNTWVLMFLPFTIMYAWYFFTYIKIQYLLTVMLPPDRDYYSQGKRIMMMMIVMIVM